MEKNVSDSDSDCDRICNDRGYSLIRKAETVSERERHIRYLLNVISNIELYEAYEVLCMTNFDLNDAVQQLQQKYNIPCVVEYEEWKMQERRGMMQSGASNERKRPQHRDDDDDYDDIQPDGKRLHIDASEEEDSDDDSDLEEVAGHKQLVFHFLQTADVTELQLVHACTQKRADAIIESRPFAGWRDMVAKFRNHKSLTMEVIVNVQKLLTARNSMKSLMKKCTTIAGQLENAIKREGAIREQPSNVPAPLKLTSYQLVGLNWLTILYEQKVNGILADEMGLGKTVQVIAFLAYLKQRREALFTHLIVVPASTLENWKNELNRWCPELNVLVYHGSLEARREIRCRFLKSPDYIDVVLATYNAIGATTEDRKLFRLTQLHYVIFDEAHMLKNMNTQRYEALSKILASQRLLLTGTPLQNNLLELVSLLIFVMPDVFSEKTAALKCLFQKSGKRDRRSVEVNFERDQIEQAKQIMKPFVLRRLKEDVLPDLPVKVDRKLEIPMDQRQEHYYAQLVADYKSASQADDAGSTYTGVQMMCALRKLANHPLLMRYHYKDADLAKMANILTKDPTYKDTVEQYIYDDLKFMSDFAINTLTQDYRTLKKFALPKNLIPKSGKFQYLDAILPTLKEEGHRVLIFSQYCIMLNIMEKYLQMRKHSYLRFDGSTPVVERQPLIDQFTQDESIFIFLLSTKAGGLGVNLTAADTVIIHDIDFNPYNDKQAEDRCHRMGQTRPVQVYRLVSKDSIEEAMWALTQEKLKLEREITSEDFDNTDVKSVMNLLSTALKVDETRLVRVLSPDKKNYSICTSELL